MEVVRQGRGGGCGCQNRTLFPKSQKDVHQNVRTTAKVESDRWPLGHWLDCDRQCGGSRDRHTPGAWAVRLFGYRGVTRILPTAPAAESNPNPAGGTRGGDQGVALPTCDYSGLGVVLCRCALVGSPPSSPEPLPGYEREHWGELIRWPSARTPSSDAIIKARIWPDVLRRRSSSATSHEARTPAR
jgi:hypothetical protein